MKTAAEIYAAHELEGRAAKIAQIQSTLDAANAQRIGDAEASRAGQIEEARRAELRAEQAERFGCELHLIAISNVFEEGERRFRLVTRIDPTGKPPMRLEIAP